MVDGLSLEENQFAFAVWCVLHLQNVVWQSALKQAFHVVLDVQQRQLWQLMKTFLIMKEEVWERGGSTSDQLLNY